VINWIEDADIFHSNIERTNPSEFLVRQAKPERSNWLRSQPDKVSQLPEPNLKYFGVAGETGNEQREQTSAGNIGRNRSTRFFLNLGLVKQQEEEMFEEQDRRSVHEVLEGFDEGLDSWVHVEPLLLCGAGHGY
jgi:hypothetical protein